MCNEQKKRVARGLGGGAFTRLVGRSREVNSGEVTAPQSRSGSNAGPGTVKTTTTCVLTFMKYPLLFSAFLQETLTSARRAPVMVADERWEERRVLTRSKATKESLSSRLRKARAWKGG